MPEFPGWVIELVKYTGIAGISVFLNYRFVTKVIDSHDVRWQALLKERETSAELEQTKWELLLAERKSESEAMQKSRERESDREREVFTQVRDKEFKLLNDTIAIVSQHTAALFDLSNHIKNGNACQLNQLHK